MKVIWAVDRVDPTALLLPDALNLECSLSHLTDQDSKSMLLFLWRKAGRRIRTCLALLLAEFLIPVNFPEKNLAFLKFMSM